MAGAGSGGGERGLREVAQALAGIKVRVQGSAAISWVPKGSRWLTEIGNGGKLDKGSIYRQGQG